MVIGWGPAYTLTKFLKEAYNVTEYYVYNSNNKPNIMAFPN